MIIHDVKQGSSEWDLLRAGKFTASNFSKLFMATTTKGYNDLINSIVYSRITGEQPESFTNDWMERGKQLEPEAIEAYELLNFKRVERIGFVEKSEWVGCSPDGFVGTQGMIQVKCPKHTTLIEYCLEKKVPKDYLYQMQGEMMVCDREWNDFFVYHPKLKPLTIRVMRDEKIINEIQAQLEIAINKVEATIKCLKEQ